VRAALGGAVPDALHAGATHTHTGIGAFWDRRMAEWIGLGKYDPRVHGHLVGAIVQAIRAAMDSLRPARVGAATLDASNYGRNRRRDGGPVDRAMTGARLESDGGTVAKLVVFGVHPTIMPRDGLTLSGDWPSWTMSVLEADGGAPTLFFQGAMGDTTWAKRQGGMEEPERVRRFGRAVASDVRGALAAGGEGEAEAELAHAEVEVALPPADTRGFLPRPLARAGSNVLQWMLGRQRVRVSYLRAGPLRLAFVPGEVVAELGMEWRRRLGASLVTVADGYVGYVETPQRLETGGGEGAGQYFGPELAPVLLEGLLAARAAAEGAAAGVAP